MGRRKKCQERTPRTLRHFRDRKPDADIRVRAPQILVPNQRQPASRLSWGHGRATCRPEKLAATLTYPTNSDVSVFCDANTLIAATAEPVWDRLLSTPERIVIVPPILSELQYWLQDGTTNLRVRDAVRRRLADPSHRGPTIYDQASLGEYAHGLEHYVNLIGMRKRAFEYLERIITQREGDKPSRQRVANECKDRFGMRTQLIAAKGVDAKVAAHRFNDEALVMFAIFDAIIHGREVVILTGDEDVFEQFYKALWLLDTHYRAMLFADIHARDPFLFRRITTDTEKTKVAFEDDVTLLKKPSVQLREVLSNDFAPVPIHCWYNKGDEVNMMSFLAEQGMARLLRIKSRTNGLSTDLFEDNNCHICLASLINTVGNYAAIGQDLFVPIGEKHRLPYTDVDLALHSQEGFTIVRTQERNSIWLPPSRRS